MPKLIGSPTVVAAADTPPTRSEDSRSSDTAVSVARMQSPAGLKKPGQRSGFREFTVVLGGTLRVQYETGAVDVPAGQADFTEPGEWIRCGTPFANGAEYVAVCLPAFSPDTVNRDAD